MTSVHESPHPFAPAHPVHVGPTLKTSLPGPRAQRIIAQDEQLMSPSYTRGYPLVVQRGHGCRIQDVDGNEFLDFTAGIAVNSTGHCHPEVVKAIQDQAAQLIHMSGTDFYYELMPQLAARLSAIAPMRGPHRIYFANSGAEAVECALKLARYHTDRQHVVSFFGSFHGRTMGALSLTASKTQQKRRFAPFVSGVTHIPYPCPYRDFAQSPDELEALGLRSARFLEEKLFKTILPPEEVAAIFVEPIQGEGGYIVPPDSFLQELRHVCDRHGILLVADEVQSGVGRTGRWWAIEHAGVEPDIVCMAKGIASGMPLGVCMTKAQIMDWVPGSHGSTFSGNPLSLAAALATLDVVEREAMANAAAIGAAALRRLHTWPSVHAIVGDVRGRGLMIGVEIVNDQQSRTPAPDLRDSIVDLAFHRGLLLLGCGQNTIRLCPPLIVNQQETDIALDILEECIAITESRLHNRNLGGNSFHRVTQFEEKKEKPMLNNESALRKTLSQVIGEERAGHLFEVLTIPQGILNESGESISRAGIAQALNMMLFEDLLARVPDAKAYADDCLRDHRRIMHDHGAVRTVALSGMGALPAGEEAITRVLRPLGYRLNGTYPLERLKMTGRSHAQAEYPEELAQFFISELHPERFSETFQTAVGRVTSTSRDPLTSEAKSLLFELEQKRSLSLDKAIKLLPVLARVFDRQHEDASLIDYELLLRESPEMAWISTEGNAFNHATDRVPDVDQLADHQKALGRPMKETVEKSQSGRVRQTAFLAARVHRRFRDQDGKVVTREVPGSFYEFITRLPLSEEEGKNKLDLSFDSSNAQAIFKMTAQSQDLPQPQKQVHP